MCELWQQGSGKLDVGLHLLHCKVWVESSVPKSMHIYNMLSNVEIFIIILLVKDHKEDVKSRHDRWRDIDIESQ